MTILSSQMKFLFTKDRKGKNKPFVVDDDDYEKVRKHSWHENGNGYIRAHINDQHVLLHRFILGNIAPKLVSHHINHDKRDNRKCNLRAISYKENAQRGPVKTPRGYVSLKTAAEILNTSEVRVYQLINSGKLVKYKVLGKAFLKRDDVLQLLVPTPQYKQIEMV